MTKQSIINSQIRAGVWHGELSQEGTVAPQLAVTHQGSPLEGVTCARDADRDVWRITVPIPPAMINEGLQTFAVSDESGNVIAHFSLLAGDPLAEDLRAEIALMRNELEILKSAFRKHCAES